MEKFDERLEGLMEKELSDLELNTFNIEEFQAGATRLERLHKIHMDREKSRIDGIKASTEQSILLRDESRDVEKSKIEKRDRMIKYAIDAAGIVLPLMLYWTWMGRGFRFEETGAITSNTFRNLISKFRPTR